MTVFHYPHCLLSFPFSQSLLFTPNYINVLGENQLLWETNYSTNEIKTHDHRRVPDSVNTQEILFTEISSHTPLRGKKKIPNLFWCEISVKAYSVFFRQTGIFYSPVASRYSSVPTSLQACLPAMMTLPLAYSYAYISMICGSESPSLSVAD